ncbi:MAG TPA: ABC transporter permease subunit, partial [Thermomicrobiales bacterium]|nr:ABC transporter permease subunit [Thermomicrobiales bacterium]
MYDLRWEYITNHFDWFIDGLLLGLKMAVIALAIGSVIGLVCAFIRASGKRWASLPVTIYVEIIRNVPLLLIVFLLYFGLPQAFAPRSAAHEWTLRLLPDAERTFIVALAIYAGAYLTEIFTAGILSV